MVGLVATALLFLVKSWVSARVRRGGLQGAVIGSWLGVTNRRGDPFGVTEALPPVDAQRVPVSTGTYGAMGLVAVVEEQGPSNTSTVCYLWIHAGMDADIVRRPDATTERTHATRGGLADRVVRAVGTSVPQARIVWTAAGSAPPPTRDEYDRASEPVRPIGLTGEGPVGAIGLALRADQVTNPVAWLRWLRGVTYAQQDHADPPPPPSVGYS